MCPTRGHFDRHPHRREFLIADDPSRGANPYLASQVDELIGAIAGFRGVGRDVLVHCHHGKSRTGLALRAWLMHTEGLDEWRATAEAEARWRHVSLWNDRFTEELRRRET